MKDEIGVEYREKNLFHPTNLIENSIQLLK